MKLRIMHYNIYIGFHTRAFKFEPHRKKAAQKLVKEISPDILIIDEAAFDKKIKYKKSFGFKYLFYAPNKSSSIKSAIAILSNYPIISSRNMTKTKHSFARVEIKIGTKKINLDVYHPHPTKTSKERINFLKKHLRKNKNNYILTGDLNSLSPEDKYPKNLLTCFKKLGPKVMAEISNSIKKETVSYILNQGMIDTFKSKNEKFDFTIPTDYLSKDKSTALRLDYIFCSKDFNILSSKIIKNKLTNQASDHYPVVTDLEIK